MRKYLLLVCLILCSPFTIHAADYYVNPSSSCEGVACDGATLDNGWKTLAAVVSASLDDADTTLWISGGAAGQTYTGTLEIVHATTTYTLTVRPMSAHSTLSAGHAGLITITPADNYAIDITSTGNNVTVSGKTTDSCTASDNYGEGCRNIKIIPPTGFGCVRKNASGEATTQNIVFRYIEFTGMAGLLWSAYTVTIPRCTSGCEIDHLYIHDGIQLEGDDETPKGGDLYVPMVTASDYGQILIHHNKIVNGTTNHVFGCLGCTVYNNYFYNDATYHCDIVHGGTSYFVFYNNIVAHDSQVVFMENNNAAGAGATEHIRIYNNILAPSTAGVVNKGIIFSFNAAQANSDIIVANNTHYGTYWGIRVVTHTGMTFADTQFVNNIYYNVGDDIPVSHDAGDPSWADDTAFILDYNLLYGGFSLYWQTATPGTFQAYTAFTGDWLTHHPTFTHNSVADPLFISSTDFRLQPSSPARTGGKDMSSYIATMPDVDKDINGVTRTNWSLGAYEYTGTIPNQSIGSTTASGAGRSMGSTAGSGSGFTLE